MSAGADYEIWIADPLGVRVAMVEQFVKLHYALAVNAPGELTLWLRPDFDPALVHLPDGRIEVWRRVPGNPAYLVGETHWFIRRRTRDIRRNGERLMELYAVSALELLNRRIVADVTKSNEANKENVAADNMIKDVVDEAMGSQVHAYDNTNRNLVGSGWLAVEGNLGAGPSLTMHFPRQNVLSVCQDIAQAAATAGTPTFFDMVVPNPLSPTFEFRTYTSNRGTDHSWPDGTPPVILGPDYGNLVDVRFEEDYTEEITFAYAMGGTELTDWQNVSSLSDSTRMIASPFNRREGLADAGSGDEANALREACRALLRNGRPRRVLAGTIQDVEGVSGPEWTILGGTRYGVHWHWGDKLTAVIDNEVIDVAVDGVTVTVEGGAETILTQLRVVE